MATIMTQGNSEGTRRCDGTCHKATKPKCACICGGRYHGCGSSQKAQEMLTEDWLGKDWKEKKAAIEAEGGSFEKVVAEALVTATNKAGFLIKPKAIHQVVAAETK